MTMELDLEAAQTFASEISGSSQARNLKLNNLTRFSRPNTKKDWNQHLKN